MFCNIVIHTYTVHTYEINSNGQYNHRWQAILTMQHIISCVQDCRPTSSIIMQPTKLSAISDCLCCVVSSQIYVNTFLRTVVIMYCSLLVRCQRARGPCLSCFRMDLPRYSLSHPASGKYQRMIVKPEVCVLGGTKST